MIFHNLVGQKLPKNYYQRITDFLAKANGKFLIFTGYGVTNWEVTEEPRGTYVPVPSREIILK